ncbi:hypothetical protein K8I85_19115 [bacterium]|nr:hypothetical protein [bacterium]
MKRLLMIGATGLAAFALLGADCMEDKIVDLILTASAEAEFQATGEINFHDDSDTVDLKAEIDLASLLADYEIDPADLDPDALKLSKILYRVVVPEAGRSIDGCELTVQRQGAASPGILVTGFSASMAGVTDWIDITPLLGAAGVTMINDFLEDCIAEVKGGPVVTDSEFTYHVTGTSNPQDDPSNFTWAVKIQLQGTVPTTFNLPNF